MIAARRSVPARTLIEMVEVIPSIVANARRREVPVDAASAVATVMTALVTPTVVVTMVVIAPEQTPVLSVHVPAHFCNVIVSVPLDVTA